MSILHGRRQVLAVVKPMGWVVSHEMVLDIFRDLIPNPFISLVWNPDRFTSTVRDIASHDT